MNYSSHRDNKYLSEELMVNLKDEFMIYAKKQIKKEVNILIMNLL